MKRTIPTFKTDKEAEDFVDTADLSNYDLSRGEVVRFVIRPSEEQRAVASIPKRMRAMKEAGLDGRHRDIGGEIQRKRSDTLNKNLSKPIPQFSPNTTLGEMRKKTGKDSETAVRRAAAKMK